MMDKTITVGRIAASNLIPIISSTFLSLVGAIQKEGVYNACFINSGLQVISFFRTDQYKSQRSGLQAVYSIACKIYDLQHQLKVSPLDSKLMLWTVTSDGGEKANCKMLTT